MKYRNQCQLEFRGIQLDIANQPENMGYIRSFVDFAAKYDFNCLALHLKSCIRTKSFPYKSASGSYSPDDMRIIVDYAAKKNVEVMPIVEAFGHVEQFLSCPEVEHLAELRGGIEGRFSKVKQVFCPSLQETHAFLENYLTEVAELFPSEYFHAGFDEAWDIGYCDLCKKRLETETQADIFTKQLLDIHGIVARKLKKKMIIWDDLFDIYPQALAKIPKDIIMCAWHYEPLIVRPSGHTGGPQTDICALYDKLGFKYIFAPWANSSRNVETFSAYAMARKPLGALLTVWGMHGLMLHSDYPTIAYAGKLWSGKYKAMADSVLLDRAVQETTGCVRKDQLNLIKGLLHFRDIVLSNSPQAYLRGPLSDQEYARKLMVNASQTALQSSVPAARARLHHDVLEDMAICAEVESIYYELRELMTALYAPGNNASQWIMLDKKVGLCIGRLKTVKTRRRQQWERHRKGVIPCQTDSYLDSIIQMLARASEEARKVKALLKVTFPEDASNVDFFVRYQDNDEWQKVGSGAASRSRCFYPLYTSRIPQAVRIEAWGYVGLWISYLEIDNGKTRYVPASIGAIEGRVSNPAALLEEGRSGNGDYCFMGDGELAARKKFCNPDIVKIRNILEIDLKPEVFGI